MVFVAGVLLDELTVQIIQAKLVVHIADENILAVGRKLAH